MGTFGKRGVSQGPRTTTQSGRSFWPYVLALVGLPFVMGYLFKPPTGTAANTFACESGASADGTVVGVRGADGHNLLQSPGGERIVNVKATEALGETHYQSIDNSTMVQTQCIDGDWARVQITEPEWLRAHVGWVKLSALDDQHAGADGFRTFSDEHFHWDRGTIEAKDAIIKAVNRLHREDARCATSISPPSVAKSPTETARRGVPVYFINCGSGDSLTNVYFEAK